MEPYSHTLVELARELRQRQTEAEGILWQKLRDRKLSGLKFRRQHKIGRYIVDFYCAELKLVVELEGGIHDMPDQKEYDEARFEELRTKGLTILRFKNEEIKQDVQAVLQRIVETIRTRPNSPSPDTGVGGTGVRVS
jgi:very-short-patch-repair endonuclease